MVFSKRSVVLSAGLMLGHASAALQPIEMSGSKFFYKNGTQFFMKGVAYQQGVGQAGAKATTMKYIDPLADAASCRRDVPILAAAGTNTIRVYQVDPTADHTACMKLLDDAGIYVIADLPEPSTAIQTDNSQWDLTLFTRYKAVIDEMGKFDNVIGFFSGNEVTNNKTNTPASAYVKAATRDSKAYIKSKGGRWMGVGYATNDDAEIRVNLAQYFNCGDQASAIDYWGYNIYSWCGDSSFTTSGYDKQVAFFRNYSVPVFLAEFGCNNQPNGAEDRTWTDIGALYSKQMTDVFSGGIAYMYFQEQNDYGLVKVDSAGKATTMKNYNAFKSAMLAASPERTSLSAYTPTNSPQACPPAQDAWRVNAAVLPPTPDKTLCDCMAASAACGPADNLDPKSYGAIFDFICARPGNLCAGINGNPFTGVYGAFSMCDAKAKLAHVLDAYFRSQNNAKDACSFNGNAKVLSGTAPSSCSSALASASSVNEAARTATGAPAPASNSSSAALAGIGGVPASFFALGDLVVGLYAVVAMGAGAAMILM